MQQLLTIGERYCHAGRIGHPHLLGNELVQACEYFLEIGAHMSSQQ